MYYAHIRSSYFLVVSEGLYGFVEFVSDLRHRHVAVRFKS